LRGCDSICCPKAPCSTTRLLIAQQCYLNDQCTGIMTNSTGYM
jgi:hypothetical protein